MRAALTLVVIAAEVALCTTPRLARTSPIVLACDPPAVPVNIQFVWNDAFPTNSALTPATDAFRRGTVRVRSGYNIAALTGDITRNTVPGDTFVVYGNLDPGRMDLIFRVKPGPGNYMTIGDPTSGLRRTPGVPVTVTPCDGSFWGTYMCDRGLYGTGYVGGGFATAVPNPMADRFGGGGLDWDPDQWLSARCDTAERNLFHAESNNSNLPQLTNARYMSAYHESDISAGGARAPLGIVKNRCVLIDPSGGAATDMSNVACDNTTYNTVPPHPSLKVWSDRWNAAEPINYVTSLTAGYIDGTCNGPCVNGTTAEFTKIIPDELLTPGSHIEYFMRITYEGNFDVYALMPDTTRFYPQTNAGSLDGFRWFDMTALPDEWKNPAYDDFGETPSGMACMLVVDQADRRGDQLLWENMAAVIHLTKTSKRGAGTGYWAGGNEAFPLDVSDLGDGHFVSAHRGSPGRLYDYHDVVSGESIHSAGHLGSRLGAPCGVLRAGKCATAGPSASWLRELYQHVVILGADLGQNAWGPITDLSDDDIGILTDFITIQAGTPSPRTIILTGRNMVQGQVADHPGFLSTYFDVGLANGNYAAASLNTECFPDLHTFAPIGGTGGPYSVTNAGVMDNDVLSLLGGISGSGVAAAYEDGVGPSLQYPAAIYAPENAGAGRYARTLALGWTTGVLGGQLSRYGESRIGFHAYWFETLTNMIGTLCGNTLTNPLGLGDYGGSGRPLAEYLRLASKNPHRSGGVKIEFRLAQPEHVVAEIFDVSGRIVRRVADRTFAASDSHVLTWNGLGDDGQPAQHGVYFYRLRSPSLSGQKKIILLEE